MASPIDNSSLNQQQSQPNSLLLLLCLPILQDLTAFLTKLVEEIQQKQAEAEKLLQAEMETKECTRLVDLMIDEDCKQLRHRKEPYLKGKTYNELCAYIKKCYPKLSNLI
ncbi:hypothetical protein L2E69_11660 [Planktothrix agardhii 1806]|jgi:hypothetical protein|uniref:hypothetical protein n=1 Tax=Planktothrix agardhii TaxID=1160 RepID=UPI001F46632D|nr:hypothetical protein [Planktothrix agardhii]MCF3571293.1 hypothetical protein [Planktothrix agardhii 1805]MCF3585817.1 hypothetical protein [Planktothrix agardhii 1803]MCF3602494.1 hypothetical protein [Planktothrix agardhii 1804]MCF3616595.1 hypothetical protein [Planktothrix agardhii 1806]